MTFVMWLVGLLVNAIKNMAKLMQLYILKTLEYVKKNIKLCINSSDIMFVLIYVIFLRNYKKNILRYPETVYNLGNKYTDSFN